MLSTNTRPEPYPICLTPQRMSKATALPRKLAKEQRRYRESLASSISNIIVPVNHYIVPKRNKVVFSTHRKSTQMSPEHLGATAALPTRPAGGHHERETCLPSPPVNLRRGLHLSLPLQLFNRHLVHLLSGAPR